jgi:hypothetical protein
VRFGRLACVALVAAFGFASQAYAQTDKSTDSAIARYRMMTSVAPQRCTTDPDPAVITVCATKLRESQKVPYIEELRVGDRPRRAFGEPPGQDPGPPCPIRGCPCPPSECGIRALAKKLLGDD